MKTKPDHLETSLLLRQKRQLQAQVSGCRHRTGSYFSLSVESKKNAATSVVHYVN